jgi:hypothetical protein
MPSHPIHPSIHPYIFDQLFLSIFLALADGALNPVLSLCAMKEAIALLAMMTLSHIVEHHGNLAPLIEVCFTLFKYDD